MSAFALPQTSCWAIGSNVSAFTFAGSQAGFAPGTVYSLSTGNPYLGICQMLPNSTATSNPTSVSAYTSTCFNNYGTSDTSGYSAITYLGTANNPKNLFVVGDSNGNLFYAQIMFNPASITSTPCSLSSPSSCASIRSVDMQPVVNMQSVPVGCPSGSQVVSLAVDPNGQYLYVGCFNGTAQESTFQVNKSNYKYYLPTYLLYSVPIETTGMLGTFTPVTGLFDLFGTSSSFTAGVWDSVSPVMRAYPANSPQLEGSNYNASGAVMVSGLVG